MGTIAFVFGWSPEVMNGMSVAELLGWQHEAVRLHNLTNCPKEG
jgi:hypothetical protein